MYLAFHIDPGGSPTSSPSKQRNRIRLYVDREKDTAARFKLRLTGEKGGELTDEARSNLLLELAYARDARERGAIRQHYGVHRNTSNDVYKKWLQRATVRTAGRSGRYVEAARGDVSPSSDEDSSSSDDEFGLG